MIINSAPANQAIMGGVSDVSEFKIRNSAKAFGILSDGLYANKIRAILRELGCNAVDSHIAADKKDVPFDVHLPTTLQPYFSVRDYGIGLDHGDVIDIYTTYFESTKTASNDFIGALGLGSKSPFSYTDNFTVTAIKNGNKGIYSAFINENGVPSVATMDRTETDEPDGVEVRFAVTNERDYPRFIHEAKQVFSYFEILPTFTGANANVEPVQYNDNMMQFGIKRREQSSYSNGKNNAIMGNIPYPIGPMGEIRDENLSHIEDEGLDIEFDIGEIDFAASREGLQYTPKTIAAIIKKYKEIDKQLLDNFTSSANKIDNSWERYYFITQHRGTIFRNVISKYVHSHPQPFFGDYGVDYVSLSVTELKEKYNIELRRFYGQTRYSYGPPGVMVSSKAVTNPLGEYDFSPRTNVMFVENLASKKMVNRVKEHMRLNVMKGVVYLICPADSSQPADCAGFYQAIHSPPSRMIRGVDDLDTIPRTKSVKVVGDKPVIKMRRDSGKWGTDRFKWETETMTVESLSDKKEKIYVEMSGYTASIGQSPEQFDVKECLQMMDNTKIPELTALVDAPLYGIRKSGLKDVKNDSSWIPLDKYVQRVVNTMDNGYIINMAALNVVDSSMHSTFVNVLEHYFDTTLPDHPLTKLFKELQVASNSRHFEIDILNKLCLTLGLNEIDTSAVAQKEQEIRKLLSLYPMFRMIRTDWLRVPRSTDAFGAVKHVLDYIKLVDEHKGE